MSSNTTALVKSEIVNLLDFYNPNYYNDIGTKVFDQGLFKFCFRLYQARLRHRDSFQYKQRYHEGSISNVLILEEERELRLGPEQALKASVHTSKKLIAYLQPNSLFSSEF